MQNWNQWQTPSGAVTAPMPPTPAGFTAPGADPMAMMQSYMQYYNQPAPSGYTAEQWAAAQQQNWAQWQQWQQQFQQWQAQYGEKYQETMKQLSAQGLSLPNVTQAPPLPSSQPLPPLPKEEHTKPPLPPDTNNPYQYANMPPPHQNNLPLFPAKSQSSDYQSKDAVSYSQAPPLPPGQPPPPTSNPQEPSSVNSLGDKRGINDNANFGSAKKSKVDDEELTEAEITFDAQFKQWEYKFNRWKQQNANHPDKAQYKEYEAKWTSWREKLIERRESMRKKREQQKQPPKGEAEKNKNIPGGDKLLNILSSSENQGLINNLLGIGKTLGLTGKLDNENPSMSSANPSAGASSMQQQQQQPAVMIPPTMTSDMTQAAWAAQQWAAQYNANVALPNYGNYQMAGSSVPGQSSQQSGNNYSQPPPNVANSGMNFSQPPPGYGANDSRQTVGPGAQQTQRNIHDRPPPPLFGPDNDKRDGFGGGGGDRFQPSSDHGDQNRERFASNDRVAQDGQFSARNNRFGQEIAQAEFGTGNRGGSNQFGSENDRFNAAADRFAGARPSTEFGSSERPGLGNQFRLDGDRPGPNEDRDSGNNRFSRDNDGFTSTVDRFGSNSRVVPGINRPGREAGNFGLGNDRFGSDIDRFSSSNDRFASNSLGDPFASGSKDRFGSEKDRFPTAGGFPGANNDRPSSGIERLEFSAGRFGPAGDRDSLNKSLGSFSSDNFASRNERFNRTDRPDVSDPFESKDPNYVNDNRRESFGDNSRGLNRNVRPFEANDSIAPELRKLMEKRRAAMDVFKPRDDVFSSVKQDNIGSLSESFKKITGESPYASRGPAELGARNLPGLGPRGPDNFMSRGPADFPPNLMGPPLRGGNNFSQQPSRGMEFPGFGNSGPGKFRPGGEFGPPRNEFSPLRGQSDFGLRGRGDFEPRLSSDGTIIDQPGVLGAKNKDGSVNLEQKQDFDNRSKDRQKNEETESYAKSNLSERADDVLRKDGIPQSECNPNILPLDRPPWMDAQFPEPKSSDNTDGAKSSHLLQSGNHGMKTDNPDNASSLETDKLNVPDVGKSYEKNSDQEMDKKNQNQQFDDAEKATAQHDNANKAGKDQNALPFMGENDPKPEDLNMEPPPELPNLGPITETPNMPAFKANSQNNELGNAFSPRPPSLLAQRGPNSPFFDTLGPATGQFRPEGPNIDQFGGRGGPNANRFEFRAPNDRQFSPRNPGDGMFGPLGPNFGPRGVNEGPFGPRGPGDGQFGPRGPAPFGPRGMQERQFDRPPQRGPNDGLLGARPTEESFGPMGQGFLGPRGPGGGQFGPRPPGHSQIPLLRGSNEGQFRPRDPNDGNYGPRGPTDGQKPAIPSLLGLQFDKQPIFDTTIAPGNAPIQAKNDFMPSGIHGEENNAVDSRRAFGAGESDKKLPFPIDQRPGQFGPGAAFPQGRPPGLEQRPPFVQGGPESRPPFERDALGNVGRRSPLMQGGPMGIENRTPLFHLPHPQGAGPDRRSPFAQGGPRGLENPALTLSFEQRIDPSVLDQRSPKFMGGGQGNMDQKMMRGRDMKPEFDPNPRGSDQHSPFPDVRKGLGGSIDGSSQFDGEFYDRSRDTSDCSRRPRNPNMGDSFCVGKQFNYNHGGSAADKKISEIRPGKVIDYGHMTKVAVHEYITPVQTFEYGHGNLKPVVPEHEIISRRDFRHWEETEQNLKEYDDRLRSYERQEQQHVLPSRLKSRDNFKFERPNSRERDWSKRERSHESEDRRNFERDVKARRDRSNREECKERERERERDRDRDRDDRNYEYGRDLDREERSWRDGNDRRDKKRETDERSDRMKVEQNREHNRDDERSKDSVNRQEYQNKSNANTTPESSAPEVKNDSTEIPSKKMELPRLPNYTMVDDILFQPGRQTRPPKIVIILRGPPGSGKSFVAKLIKDKEVEQGGSPPRILSLDDYFLVEKEMETKDDNGKRVVSKEMVYEYEEAMEQSYSTSLVKAFKKNITDGYFNFIILDCINEKISDYEEMWSFAKTKGFQVYVCEMEMDVHVCMKRNIHNRTEEEINKIVDYFEPTPNYHLKLDVNAMLQEAAIDEVQMEDSQQSPEKTAAQTNEDSQDSQDDKVGVSKWEKMDADDKLDRLDGLAKKKNEIRPQTMEDFLQVPDYYNMEDTPGKKRVRWADLEERKEQEKLRAVGFVVGHTNWDRMMDPTKGQSALTRTKYI